jgi:hypothetical protein
MKKNMILKKGLFAGLMAFVFAGQSNAVDLAASAGVMTDVQALSVQAKANLATAAVGGDVDAVAEANKRSDAIDAAVAAAQRAYSSMTKAMENNDQTAAESAEDSLAAALQQCKDALTGVLPEASENGKAKWKESKDNTGGGPGKPGDTPNIYDVPWKSQGIRAYYQSLFGSFHDASAFGHGRGFGDRDATPE